MKGTLVCAVFYIRDCSLRLEVVEASLACAAPDGGVQILRINLSKSLDIQEEVLGTTPVVRDRRGITGIRWLTDVRRAMLFGKLKCSLSINAGHSPLLQARFGASLVRLEGPEDDHPRTAKNLREFYIPRATSG